MKIPVLLIFLVLKSFSDSKRCGTVSINTASEDRISEGNIAERGAWPWMVSLQANYSGFLAPTCGGALISRQWVLTAAHCIELTNLPAKQWVAAIADHNLEEPEEGELQIAVSRYVVHEKFSMSPEILNDIALMKLKVPVDFDPNPFINTICLPQVNIPYEKYTCFAAGWGMLNLDEEQTTVLQQVQIPIIDQKVCEQKYSVSTLRIMNDDYLCAGYENKGSCAGDSGSPLFCQVDDQWHVVGVTSGGEFSCGTPEFPTIYTRVTSYLDWIAKYVK